MAAKYAHNNGKEISSLTRSLINSIVALEKLKNSNFNVSLIDGNYVFEASELLSGLSVTRPAGIAVVKDSQPFHEMKEYSDYVFLVPRDRTFSSFPPLGGPKFPLQDPSSHLSTLSWDKNTSRIGLFDKKMY